MNLRNAIWATALYAGMVSPTAWAAPLASARICTGVRDGNYDFSGTQIAAQLKGAMNVTLVNTAGSLENLAKLDSGECDAAIVQSDAFNVFRARSPRSTLTIEKGRALYPEYVHLICNARAELSKITGLRKGMTVLVGANGSGSAVTFDGFRLADPDRYGPIGTLPIGGLRGLGKVQEGSEATCLLFVTGLKAPLMNDADKMAADSGGSLRLIPANDSDLPNLRDARGVPVYTTTQVPGGTYPKSFQTGWGGSAIGTISVQAIFVTNTRYIDNDEAAYNTLLRGVNNAVPMILERVTPK